MKITANRREELEKARAEYDAETKKITDKKEAQVEEWSNAVDAQAKQIEQRVSDEIGPTSLQMTIRVDPYRSYSLRGKASWGVRIEVNEHKHSDPDTGLIWHWEAMIGKDGEVQKETGSWSGLQAVTEAQLADLEESVRVLKILNTLDWEDILHTARPDYDDYVDEDLSMQYQERKNARPQFEDQIIEAQLEELIDTDIAVKLSESQYYKGEAWILLTGLTEKFVKGYIFPQYFLSYNYSTEEIRQKADLLRTGRNKLVLHDGNLVTLDLNNR